MHKASDRLIVALDVDTAERARSIVDELNGQVGAFKVGLQLFTSEGPQLVRDLVSKGVRIFLDLKFNDIPNTVAKASLEAAKLGVWMFNVHSSGGGEMMRTASDSVREFCARENVDAPLMIAVTVLTSSNAGTLGEVGVSEDVEASVARLAKLASSSGFDGVVASAHEVGLIRNSVGNRDFKIVTPGIRPSFAATNDQKRIMTPAEALSAGSDYLVVGRPITDADDLAAAAAAVAAEMDTVGV